MTRRSPRRSPARRSTWGRWGAAGRTPAGSSGLRRRGVAEADLARIAAPIGLPIGARTPDQIALAVLAQVVAARNQAGGSTAPGAG